jgi:hypothetical protein
MPLLLLLSFLSTAAAAVAAASAASGFCFDKGDGRMKAAIEEPDDEFGFNIEHL